MSLEEIINCRQQRQPSRPDVMGHGICSPSRIEIFTRKNRTFKDKNKSQNEENKSLIEENESLKQQLAKMAKRIQDLKNQTKTLTLISKEQEKQMEEFSRLNKQKK